MSAEDQKSGSADSKSNDPNLSERIIRLSTDLRQIVEKRMELWTIRIGEQLTGLFAETLYRIIGVILLAVAGLLLLFSLASFIGELIGNESLGYLIVAAPFLIIGLLFANKRPKSVIKNTQNQMMEQFYANLQEKTAGSEEESEHEEEGSESIKSRKDS